MISYAQNREDVLLNRVFRNEPHGFYVDVGAGHPVLDSVTRWFSDQGWRGINIEPRQDMFHLLARQRPRDLNLNIGVSDRSGILRFYHIELPEIQGGDGGGLSTLDSAIAEQYRRQGRSIIELPIAVESLTEVCDEHRVGEISFLKIDVEGHERQVIEGLNLSRFRPRIVVVEATLPQTTLPCHAVWEPSLLRADYLYATFDGLNRYYVRSEDRALVELLQVPVNVLDDYVPHQVIELQKEVKHLRRKLKKVRSRHFGNRTANVLRGAASWLRARRAG